MILQSQRRWLDLKHMDFRARAFRIPFTLKQLEHINWSHRRDVQTLVLTLCIYIGPAVSALRRGIAEVKQVGQSLDG
jgi:hypothetical protein